MAAGSNFSIIVTGQQGSGKSMFAKRTALLYPKKVLYIAPDDNEDLFDDVPDLSERKQSKSRIMKTVWDDSLKNGLLKFTDGLLIFDDAPAYWNHWDRFWRHLVTRKRHFNRDIIFIMHTPFDFPPKLLPLNNGIYIFPFIDTEKRMKGRLPNGEDFDRAWSEVNRTGKPLYFSIFR